MAMAFLTGVLEDGSTRGRMTPDNVRQTLAVTQGATTQVVVKIINAAGVPVTSGDLALRVGRSPDDLLTTLTGAWAPQLGAGTAIFTFQPITLSDVLWGRYVYDVRLIRSGAVDFVIPASPLVLQPAI